MTASSRTKTNRHFRNAVARCEMPADFRRDVFSVGDFAPQLERFHITQSDADRETLMRQMLPLVAKLAGSRRAWSGCSEDLDELVSDGCMVLGGIISRYHALPASRFLELANVAIRGGFLQGREERQAYRRPKSEKQLLLVHFRQKFTRDNGRVPTAEEKQTFLATLIINPNMEVKPERKKHIPFSVLKDEGLSESHWRRMADPHVSVAPLIDKDTIEFALKGFVGTDRKIFKMVIDGMPGSEIGKLLNLNKKAINHRINALLWQARCRCDLARAMGVEAAASPMLNAYGKPMSIKKVPPARMVG
jgi:hypothetical protein